MRDVTRATGSIVNSTTPHTQDQRLHRSETIKLIRGILGRTQAELATALGVSTKAVQSYEQGWRDVPIRVMIQLLVLLALYRRQVMDDVPCWEIRRCPADMREKCAAFMVGRGQFCWFIGGKTCTPESWDKSAGIMPCMQCPVVHRLLQGSAPYAPKVRKGQAEVDRPPRQPT